MGRVRKDAWDVGKCPVFPWCNTTVSGVDSMNLFKDGPLFIEGPWRGEVVVGNFLGHEIFLSPLGCV